MTANVLFFVPQLGKSQRSDDQMDSHLYLHTDTHRQNTHTWQHLKLKLKPKTELKKINCNKRGENLQRLKQQKRRERAAAAFPLFLLHALN